MRLTYPTTCLVLGPSHVETEPPIGPTTHNITVVIVLTVVLPPAFVADLETSPLFQSAMTTAGAGVLLVRGQRDDVSEALGPSKHQHQSLHKPWFEGLRVTAIFSPCGRHHSILAESLGLRSTMSGPTASRAIETIPGIAISSTGVI